MWGKAALLKEANAISIELNKRVEFQFVLLSDTLYSPLPTDFVNNQRQRDEFFDSMCSENNNNNNNNGNSASDCHRDKLKTVIGIEVQDFKNGAVHYWTLDKFK